MNVLCFVMDDMDNEMYQYMPYLSGLPEGDWVRFSNSYQSTPLCGPSRANMLLGQRYTETGVEENSDCPTDMISRESDIVWTQLQADGAATAAVGKYTNNWIPGTHGHPAGLDKAFIKDTEGADADAYTNWNARDYVAGVTDTVLSNVADYSTDRYATETVEFLSTAAEPWFCWVAFGAPHNPRTPAAGYAATSITIADPLSQARLMTTDRPAWMPSTVGSVANHGDWRTNRLDIARCMLSVDDAIQAVIAEVDGNAQLANTVIIVVNDNGVGWGNHGIQGNKRNPLKWCLDASLMIRYPGAGNRIDRRLVSTLDLAPTIFDVMGVTASHTMAGRSLVPVLEDTATEWRTSVHSAFVGLDETTMPDWWHVRKGRWAYTELDEDDDAVFEETTLFDLNADPYEQRNVAATETAVVAELADLLADYKADPTLFPTR